ncbi:class II aldolase/adducin family protein [Haloarculaceae archaeon H-GB11]|nr:class II aldolase/adducin family protein [Haloarculaceae archaeon H-GB11]
MLEAERRAVAEHSSALADLTPGRTGNLSVRAGDSVAITPTGVAYDEIDPDDVPVVSLAGDHEFGSLEASSETPMHCGIYETFDAGAVVHTHSDYATTLAVLGDPLPPVHYMVAFAGETVPVADYATYGTRELADNAVGAMERADSGACLLANHGLVATGTDAADAVETASAVESVARVYCQARSIGDPVELDSEEMATVAEKFGSYGQPSAVDES